MSEKKSPSTFEGMAQSLKTCERKSLLAVETWDPPYCGDIGLAIQANGTWTYQGSPISRPALLKLFSSVLYKDINGHTYLKTPYEKVEVIVADAAFVANRLEIRGQGKEQTLLFHTNLEDCAPANQDHPLRFEVNPITGAIKPYILIRHRLEALLTRDVTRQLLGLINDNSTPGIWSGGLFFKIPNISLNEDK